MDDKRPEFGFNLIATDGMARRGTVQTGFGAVQTPAFMPVGTAASVKGMMPDAVAGTGAEIILSNTYHLMLRPGAERVGRLGGVRVIPRLRDVVAELGMVPVPGLTSVPHAGEAFTPSGRLADASLESRLTTLIDRLLLASRQQT